MVHSKQTITLSISPQIISRLRILAAEHHVPIEEVATDLIYQALQIKKHDPVRVVQMDQKGHFSSSDSEILREIIQRQDGEITWLREQIARLSTLTPTTHVIRHEYPAISDDTRVLKPLIPDENKQFHSDEEKEEDNPDVTLPSQISLEDVQYNVTETGMESDDLITSEYSGHARVGEQTLRDSIGGVREEKKYSVREAAAIAGESESVLLEYISDGFLPAERDGTEYRIQGVDLRRYIMSR